MTFYLLRRAMGRSRSLGVGLDYENIGKGIGFDDEDTGTGHLLLVSLRLA